MKSKFIVMGMFNLALTFGLVLAGCASPKFDEGGRYAPNSQIENDCTLMLNGSSAPGLPTTNYFTGGA